MLKTIYFSFNRHKHMMIYYTQILLHINQCNNCLTFNNLNKYKLHKKLFVHVTQVADDPNIYKI